MNDCLKGECSDFDGDCSPCHDCPDCEPVLPRCDIALPDGVFNHASVVVEGGCITEVRSGEPFVYDPDVCCAEPGAGGGGGGGLDGPPGRPGQNATIRIGQINTVGPGQQASVTNSGTNTAAVLNFNIPRGEKGESADGIGGVTENQGGWTIENGMIKSLPPIWPSLASIVASASSPGYIFEVSESSPNVFSLSLDASAYDTNIKNHISQQISNAVNPIIDSINSINGQINAINNQISSLSSRVSALEVKG